MNKPTHSDQKGNAKQGNTVKQATVAATAQDTTVAVAEPVATPSVAVTAQATPAPSIRRSPVVSEAGKAARLGPARRTHEGKFNKIAFIFIGGTECPKYAPMTWEARDKFMASGTPEANAVKARYEQHLQGKAPYQQKPGPVTAGAAAATVAA